MRSSTFLFALCAAGLWLSSCGGGSKPAPQPRVEDFTLVVSYPTANASLAGQSTDTVVTGRIESTQTVGYSDVNYVSVNGQMAQLDLHDPSRWSARVPVGLATDLSVAAGFSNGDTLMSDQVLFNHRFFSAGAVVLDEGRGKAWMVDVDTDGIVEIDLQDGSYRWLAVVSDGARTPNIPAPDLCLDTQGNRLIVLADEGLYDVDLDTGDTRYISGEPSGGVPVGDGTSFYRSRYMACDVTNNRAFVTNGRDDQILSVDLTTGDRAILSGRGYGSGFIRKFMDMVADPQNDRLLVADTAISIIWAVSMSTGDRTVFSGSEEGEGPALYFPLGMIMDAANARLIVGSPDSLIAVDIATGDRSPYFYNEDFAADPKATAPYSFALESGRNRILMSGLQTLFRMDPATGGYESFVDSSIGTGSSLESVANLLYDTTSERLFGKDSANSFQIFEIDLSDASRQLRVDYDAINFWIADIALDAVGQRVFAVDRHPEPKLMAGNLNIPGISLVSGTTRGTGPPLGVPTSIAFDAVSNTAYVANTRDSRILAVDVLTGDRTLIANDGGVGTGPSVAGAAGLTLNESADTLYYIADNEDEIISLDLSTRVRAVVAGPSVGIGVVPVRIADLAFDGSENRLLATDRGQKQVYAVDLVSGDRTPVSGGGVGSGLGFGCPRDIVFDGRNNRAFVADTALGAIVVVEMTTGERAVVGKSPVGAIKGC